VGEFQTQPLLWERGRIHLLNLLIDPASGWTLVTAQDINDQGEIVATARLGPGPYRAVRLLPVVGATAGR
jgi:hypothetical protein